MCIVADPGLGLGPAGPLPTVAKSCKQSSKDDKKEKSRDAARERRAKEFEYFQELEQLLPVQSLAAETQKESVDKTSLIRLAVAFLKSRQVAEKGLTLVKEEAGRVPEDPLSCLDGFTIVLGAEGDVIFVSKNITDYVGLRQVEMLGQTLADYIHPCDLASLAALTAPVGEGEEQQVEAEVRMKCTVTERGRMVNLNQASYKPLRISGHTRGLGPADLKGPVFLGTASPASPLHTLPHQLGVFASKHSLDMKFTEVDHWFALEAGYPAGALVGESLFTLVHPGDTTILLEAFTTLREQGQCCTRPYRLLAHGGGHCWVETRASSTPTRRGSSKGASITCQHWQVSAVERRGEVVALVQGEPTLPRSVKVPQQQATPRAVVIQPREVRAPPPSSLPTSVIVTSSPAPLPRPAPRPVTGSIFAGPKTPKATTSMFFKAPATPVVVEPCKTPKVATSLFFKAPDQGVVVEPLATASQDNILQEAAKQVNALELEEERSFFDSLFNYDSDMDMDKLAPHNGDDCLELKPNPKDGVDSDGGALTPDEDSSKGNEDTGEDFFHSLFSFPEVEQLTSFLNSESLSGEGGGLELDLLGIPESPGGSDASALLHPDSGALWATSDPEEWVRGGAREPSESEGGGGGVLEPPLGTKRRMAESPPGAPCQKVRLLRKASDQFVFLIE